MGLVKRWAFFDKSFRLDKKNFSDEKILAKAKEFDKMNHADQVKKNMLPFETLFFELGAEVLKNVDGFLAANPDKAIQNIRKLEKTGNIPKPLCNQLSKTLNASENVPLNSN